MTKGEIMATLDHFTDRIAEEIDELNGYIAEFRCMKERLEHISEDIQNTIQYVEELDVQNEEEVEMVTEEEEEEEYI